MISPCTPDAKVKVVFRLFSREELSPIRSDRFDYYVISIAYLAGAAGGALAIKLDEAIAVTLAAP